jgi:hypothetical protein
MMMMMGSFCFDGAGAIPVKDLLQILLEYPESEGPWQCLAYISQSSVFLQIVQV